MLWLAILGALLAVLSLVASTVTGGISAREAVVANQKEEGNTTDKEGLLGSSCQEGRSVYEYTAACCAVATTCGS